MKNAVNTLKTTVAAVALTLSANAALAGGYTNNPQPGNANANSNSHAHANSNANANAGVNANLGQATNVGVGQSAKLNGGNTHVDNEIETGDVSVNQGPVTAGGATVGVQNGNKNYVEGTDVETEITGTNTNNIGPTTSTSHGGQGGKGGYGEGGDVEAEISDNSDRSQTQTTDASSQNANSQNTEVGGNNSSYTNNSVYKGAAATNIPQASAIFATKSCVSSHSFGISGGVVTAAYAGWSWSYVGSGAVELTGTEVNADGEEVPVSYTIPELAEMSPQERAQIMNNLGNSEAAKTTCLMGEYQTLTLAYEHATNIAKINGETQILVEKIRGYADTIVEQIRQDGQATTASIDAYAEVIRLAMIHACNLGPTVIQIGEHKQEIHPDTLAIGRDKVSENENGHELCGTYMNRALDKLDSFSNKDRKPIEANFEQFTPNF